MDQRRHDTSPAAEGEDCESHRRELKIIDEAASGSAPVLNIELSEVLAPLDKAERRTR